MLSAPDGATVRAHLESAERQWARLGKKRKRNLALAGPPLPAALAYLWHYYMEIAGVRPERLGWLDLLAWASLNRIALRPWEATALMRLEAALHKSKVNKRLPDSID